MRLLTCPLLIAFLLSTTACFGAPTGNERKKLKIAGNFYVPINDTLYAAVYETTQKEYKEFLSFLLPEDYERYKIDSSRWVKTWPVSANGPMSRHYHTHGAFDRYPVVNISYEAAVKFCEWLTRRYRLSYPGVETEFRLPTEAEWLLLAAVDTLTQLPTGMDKNAMRKDGHLGMNFKPMTNDSSHYGADGGFYTVRTDMYDVNTFGLYCVMGNAAEMTSTPGIQKGGSWEDTLEVCRANKVQTFSTPDPRVGFRVVMIKHTPEKKRRR